MKRAAKNYTIEEFYQNYVDIIHDVAVDKRDSSSEEAPSKPKHPGRFFPENGMFVNDCEVLSIEVEHDVANMLVDHQREMVKKSLQLSAADKRVQVAEKLAVAEQKENELKSQQLINQMNLQREEALRKLEIQTEVNRMKDAEEEASKNAEKDLQVIYDAIADAERARKEKDNNQIIEAKKAEAAIEKAKQEAYAETVASIMNSVSPDLIAALTSISNHDMANVLFKSVAPYAIAKGESVSDFTNKLVRGLPLEEALEKIAEAKKD
jgi:hypothetical protein